MGKGIESWTDVDYAQAAIDMLPESVEEIAEFLRAQGIGGSQTVSTDRCGTCPVARWVNKWTDWPTRVNGEDAYASLYNMDQYWQVLLPDHVQRFIEDFDFDKVKV